MYRIQHVNRFPQISPLCHRSSIESSVVILPTDDLIYKTEKRNMALETVGNYWSGFLFIRPLILSGQRLKDLWPVLKKTITFLLSRNGTRDYNPIEWRATIAASLATNALWGCFVVLIRRKPPRPRHHRCLSIVAHLENITQVIHRHPLTLVALLLTSVQDRANNHAALLWWF